MDLCWREAISPYWCSRSMLRRRTTCCKSRKKWNNIGSILCFVPNLFYFVSNQCRYRENGRSLNRNAERPLLILTSVAGDGIQQDETCMDLVFVQPEAPDVREGLLPGRWILGAESPALKGWCPRRTDVCRIMPVSFLRAKIIVNCPTLWDTYK